MNKSCTLSTIGLLGESFQFPGRGSDRRFNFKDVCTARVVQEVLSIASNFRIAHKAAKSFRRYKGKMLANMVIAVYKKDEKIVTSSGEVVGERKKGEIHISWSKFSKDSYNDWNPHSSLAVLVIPVNEIMEDVRNAFPELVNEV